MKVVLIGDSIRMGYQPLVAKKLEGRAEVWGPQQNCRHSLWALDHFQDWVAAQEPDVLHVNFGIHDAVVMADGKHQVILEQYLLCLRRFVRCGKDLPATVIWATTTPRYRPEQGVPMGRWAKMTEIDEYNAAALDVAAAEGLPVDDLHQVILDSDYAKCLRDDGCHMTQYGNEALSDAVVKAVCGS